MAPGYSGFIRQNEWKCSTMRGSSMPDSQALEFSGVTKQFGAMTAVSNFSTRVEPGVVTGFLGPNGAGKSTTLRMLLGLVRPTSGTATVGGQPYRALRNPAQTVGAVLEATSFHPGRTAANHLSVYAKAAKIAKTRVGEVLELVGLSDAADRKVGGYSLGMRQRLALATALLGDPGILVLDEPTNGLDPEGITWIRGFLRALAAEGRTVFVSSHLLAEVQQTADRLVMISGGRLVFQGGFEDLIDGDEDVSVVDAPDRAALSAALDAAGLSYHTLRSGLNVRGASPAAVGAAAAAGGVALSALSRKGESLEDVFFQLVNGTRVHPSAGGVPTELADELPEAADGTVALPVATDVVAKADETGPEEDLAADDAPDVAVDDAFAAITVPGDDIVRPGVVVAAAARSAKDFNTPAAVETEEGGGSEEDGDTEADGDGPVGDDAPVVDVPEGDDDPVSVGEVFADEPAPHTGAFSILAPSDDEPEVAAQVAPAVTPAADIAAEPEVEIEPAPPTDAEIAADAGVDAAPEAEAQATHPFDDDTATAATMLASLFDNTTEVDLPAGAQDEAPTENEEVAEGDTSVDSDVQAEPAPWWKPADAPTTAAIPTQPPAERAWWQPAEMKFPLSQAADDAEATEAEIAPEIEAEPEAAAEADVVTEADAEPEVTAEAEPAPAPAPAQDMSRAWWLPAPAAEAEAPAEPEAEVPAAEPEVAAEAEESEESETSSDDADPATAILPQVEPGADVSFDDLLRGGDSATEDETTDGGARQ